MSRRRSSSKAPITHCNLVRQCKITSYKEFFAESFEGVDEPAIDDSSTDESEDDEDRLFLVQDECSGSEDDFVPQDDSSEDDDASVSTDPDHDCAGDSGGDYDLRDIYAVLVSDVEDGAAAKENESTK
ncbi:hypothetical protein N0V95_009510 [Ascochyta clinopodiicola]|nr:hypothetical protein N0V95_009510 [Ascochyta clinopodiicola]